MSEQVTPSFTPAPALSPEAARAADWLRDLSRVARTSRLYSASNSVIETAREEFARKTGDGVEEAGGWTFQILPEEILFGEEFIVRPPRRGPTRGATAQRLLAELPFRLYRDGVRELSLLPGIPRRDVDALVDAVALAWTDRNRADDVVTSLWQSNPTHIRVEAAPPEQMLYVATGVGAEETASRGVGLGLGLPPLATDIRADLGDRGGAVGLQKETGLEQDPVAVYMPVRVAYEALQSEVGEAGVRFLEGWARESTRPWWDEAREVCAAVYADLPGADSEAVLVRFAVTGVLEAIDRTAWADAVELLAFARELTGDPARADAALKEALAQVGKSDLGEKLDASSADDLAAFFRLVIALDSAGVPLALTALGTSRHARQRAAAAASLTHLCATDPALLAPSLDDPRPEFVQAVVKTLGHIGGAGVAPLCRIAARHPDSRVTREVANIVPALPEPERTDLLLDLLHTPDPETLLVALRSARRAKSPRATQALLRMIEGVGFDERPENVRRALFQSLAEIGDADVVPPLEAILTQGNWFARASWRRTAAAHALAQLAIPEAQSALERARKHASDAVRTACRSAAERGQP